MRPPSSLIKIQAESQFFVLQFHLVFWDAKRQSFFFKLPVCCCTLKYLLTTFSREYFRFCELRGWLTLWFLTICHCWLSTNWEETYLTLRLLSTSIVLAWSWIFMKQVSENGFRWAGFRYREQIRMENHCSGCSWCNINDDLPASIGNTLRVRRSCS